MKSESFTQKATKTSNLHNRVEANLKYGTKDFSAWTMMLLSKVQYRSVLDVCCGTGNQLVIYAENPALEKIAGVDLSTQSLEVAKERLQSLRGSRKIVLAPLVMEQMFSSPELADEKFDLISCFYGLYYSKDVSRTLTEMLDHLEARGSILIVGPYGANNKTLFDVLHRYFKLPELVLRSASTFMEEEVLPFLKKHCRIETETMVNRIEYPDVDSVMTYWRSSTFHSSEYEDPVRKELEKIFQDSGRFIVEKHIMAILGRRK